MKYFVPLLACLFLLACDEENEKPPINPDSLPGAHERDSAERARNLVANDKSRIKDTVFHTALPPVFEGDIILENYNSPQTQLAHLLMGGKYNQVGIIFQRPKDGMLMVIEVLDSVRLTPLTEFVDRADSGHVCLMRLKDANKTLTEEKVTALRQSARAYKGVPFDPVLNWDDSGLYGGELVWKIFNNAMRLTLCPTRKVGDFEISAEKKKELNTAYKKNVSDQDEAVSPDDIYHSKKLDIIYEK